MRRARSRSQKTTNSQKIVSRLRFYITVRKPKYSRSTFWPYGLQRQTSFLNNLAESMTGPAQPSHLRPLGLCGSGRPADRVVRGEGPDIPVPPSYKFTILVQQLIVALEESSCSNSRPIHSAFSICLLAVPRGPWLLRQAAAQAPLIDAQPNTDAIAP
jgi:hypothetical protein